LTTSISSARRRATSSRRLRWRAWDVFSRRLRRARFEIKLVNNELTQSFVVHLMSPLQMRHRYLSLNIMADGILSVFDVHQPYEGNSLPALSHFG
jgi:hypothetical protein